MMPIYGGCSWTFLRKLHPWKKQPSLLPIYDIESFGKEQSWLFPRYILLLPTKGLYVLLLGPGATRPWPEHTRLTVIPSSLGSTQHHLWTRGPTWSWKSISRLPYLPACLRPQVRIQPRPWSQSNDHTGFVPSSYFVFWSRP